MTDFPNKASALIHLSQANLNLLEICPPKFQQIYLDGLASLPDPEQQESLDWGSRFHLLMQQQELGLPIASLLEKDEQLNNAFASLTQAAPQILTKDSNSWREAEHCRTLGMGNFLLTVIYDLIIAETDKATIFDWKTYRQPPKKSDLAKNWQTRLYLYVLAETSDYLPEQISLTYWFIKSANPKSHTFQYSAKKHQNTQRDLRNLLNDLEQRLEAYQQHQTPFPHRVDCEKKCPFARDLNNLDTQDNPVSTNLKNCDRDVWRTSIAEIEEVSI
ncbi:MAG: PD-(D/E)XK nuclease family protein [Pleurocapsa sp.]